MSSSNEGGFTSRTTSFSQQVVVGNRTVRKVVGDKTVSLTFLPFIRSREISFRAEGLRPNSRYFPFFDGKDVATFCKEKAFQRHASGTFLSGKENRLATTHPEGSSNLISNSNGEIAGSFFNLMYYIKKSYVATHCIYTTQVDCNVLRL